jgi:hypothetical protein
MLRRIALSERPRWHAHALAFLVALAAHGTTASAQTPFEGVITARHGSPDAGDGSTIRYSVRQGRMRIEVSAAAIPTPGIFIVDLAAGERYLLSPSSRTYALIPTATKPETPAAPGGSGPAASATGRRETVAGHSCEHYRIRFPAPAGIPAHVKVQTPEMDVCLASHLPSLPASIGLAGLDSDDWMRALAGKPGFPLMVRDTDGETVFQVTSIRATPLSATLFAPPPDYRQLMGDRRP